MDSTMANDNITINDNTTLNFSGFENVSRPHYGSAENSLHVVIYQFLMKYILPLIIFCGLIGNLLSIWTFMGKNLRHISSSVYILAVLVADTGVLVSLLFVWLEALGYRLNHEEGTCQFLVYWSYVCTFLSVWFVVCITVENYITICHPTRIKTMCTLNRALFVSISLTSFALFAYSSSIFSVKVGSMVVNGQSYHRCIPAPDMARLSQLVVYIDSIITLFVPSVLIFLMLVAISLSVVRSLKMKKTITVKKKSKKENGRKKRPPQVRVAKMLFVLSLTYFILNVPSHVYRLIGLFGQHFDSQELSHASVITQLILLFIYYSNFSVKFFCFLTCSKNFRKILMKKIHVNPALYSEVRSSVAE